MAAKRTTPKVHDHARDLVLVGDDYQHDDSNMFGRGDLALMSMELDRQVATAKRFPRNEAAAVLAAKRLVSETEDTALACIYSLPRGGKIIPGPSVRLAEALVYCWTNARAGTKIVAEEDEFIVAQGFYFDLERNIACSRTVRRRIIDSDGRRYNIDMVQTTGAAAQSIALRNSVLYGGIPEAIWRPIYDTAASVIGGAAKPLSQRRQMAIEAFVKMGVPAEKVLARLKLASMTDMEQEHIVALRGLRQSIKDEVLTLEQAFPEPRSTQKRTDVGAKVREGTEAAKKKAGKKPAGEAKGAPEQEQGGDTPAQDAASAGAAAPAEGDAKAKDSTPATMEAVGKAVAAEVENREKASDEGGLPQDDRDVIDELRALVGKNATDADRKKAQDDFREAVEAMTPEGRRIAERIIGLKGARLL